MSDLKKLFDIDWQLVVSRNERPLFMSFTAMCYRRFRNIAGIFWEPRYELRLGPGLYHEKHELDRLRILLRYGGVPLFHRFQKRLISRLNRFRKLGYEFARTKVETLSTRALASLLNRYIDAALSAHTFLLPMPVADAILSNMLLQHLPKANEEKRQRWLRTLTFPLKENEHTKEARGFFRLARLHKKHSSQFSQQLRRHLHRFAWIGGRSMWWEYAWQEKDVIERINNYNTGNNNPLRDLRHLDAIRTAMKRETNTYIRTLRLKKIQPLISLGKQFAFLRTFRTDTIYKVSYDVRTMFYEIARRRSIRSDNISYYTYPEIVQLLRHQCAISEAEIAQRKYSFATYRQNNRYTVITRGSMIQRIKKSLAIKRSRVTEVRGTPVFHGKVLGRVIIVRDQADLHKVRRGNILVAVMTFPSYISAMEKATAFVTDEGGILCHAAIVAREMKKPCIIGTKIATRIFKDGDRVKVDAVKGVVRKL